MRSQVQSRVGDAWVVYLKEKIRRSGLIYEFDPWVPSTYPKTEQTIHAVPSHVASKIAKGIGSTGQGCARTLVKQPTEPNKGIPSSGRV